MKPRQYWLDFARAVGITLVVFGHVALGLQSAGILPVGGAMDVAVSAIYVFHMPLFFFLSGLLFMPSLQRHGAAGLLRGKLDTIVWPFVLWSLVQGAIEVQMSAYRNDATTWSQVLGLFWQPRGQFWFLYALFFIFVYATAWFSAFPRRGLPAALLLGVAAYLLPRFVPDPAPLMLPSQGLVFFLLGVAHARHAEPAQLGRPLVALGLLAVAVAAQLLFHAAGLRSDDRGLPLLLVACCCIFAVVALSRLAARWPVRALARIGADSMPIFLVHVLTGSGARIVLQRLFAVESAAVHLVVGMAAGLLLPMAAAAAARRLGIGWPFEAPLSRLLPGGRATVPGRHGGAG